MTLAERNRPERPAPPPVVEVGLAPEAGYRLEGALKGILGYDSRRQAIEHASSMIPGVLKKIGTQLRDARPSEDEPMGRMWTKDDKQVMTAVHILSIAGYDCDYKPIQRDGKRWIETKHPDLLEAVNDILVDSAGRVENNLRQSGLDEPARSWATSQAMDEIGYSIYGELRSERDIRRQAEAAGKKQEVVLLDRTA